MRQLLISIITHIHVFAWSRKLIFPRLLQHYICILGGHGQLSPE